MTNEQEANKQLADSAIGHAEPRIQSVSTEHQKWYTKPIRYTEKITFTHLMEGLAFLLACVVAFIYSQQLQVMSRQLDEMEGGSSQTAQIIIDAAHSAKAADESNKTTKEALVSVQRAFVFLNKDYQADFVRTDGGLTGIELGLKWENSGATPAKNCRQHIEWVFSPKRISSETEMKESSKEEEPCLLGPEGAYSVPTKAISEDDWNKVSKAGGHIYFLGWVKYNDVFKDTARHVTRICYEFRPHSGAAWTSPAFGLLACPFHNCYDEECKD